ncbi:hypothetical protein LJR231_005614 [Phyllobacterium sp. LjRoot231]|uniref:hypothetical protein n=1 Tax=Phyllobacterium sp. LjRoot231 TaxID=3342289 RepID=UPI003ECF0F89
MVIKPEEKPFFATVGSFSNVPWHDALVAFVAFYHNWFKNKPLFECVEVMKAASGHNSFVIYSGEEQKQAFIHHINTQRIIAALSRPTAPTGGLTGLLSNPAPATGPTR